MKIKGEYEKVLYFYFKQNHEKLLKFAQKIIRLNGWLPLEKEDLVAYAHFELFQSENKIKYFKIKSNNENVNDFLSKEIFKLMSKYCDEYQKKKHQILTKSINEFNEEIVNSKECNYTYKELFDFLTKEEFAVMYNILVNKIKRKELANRMNISVYKLKQIENTAISKINKNF